MEFFGAGKLFFTRTHGQARTALVFLAKMYHFLVACPCGFSGAGRQPNHCFFGSSNWVANKSFHFRSEMGNENEIFEDIISILLKKISLLFITEGNGK